MVLLSCLVSGVSFVLGYIQKHRPSLPQKNADPQQNGQWVIGCTKSFKSLTHTHTHTHAR